MLTPPPVNAGSPRPGAEPIRSIMNNRLLVDQVLTMIGTLMDMAQISTGCTTADLAEWTGTTLIRWAEQDRVEMRRHPTRTTNK
jgi:hypothetical protein